MSDICIAPNDRNRLRELAKRYLEISRLPETEEKIKAWYAHNRCEGYRPMVVMEHNFWGDIRPQLLCESPAAQFFEDTMQGYIVAHELIGDDKVTPPYIQVPIVLNITPFGMEAVREYSSTGSGGFHIVPQITDITRDLDTLPATTYAYDAEGTQQRLDWIDEAVGDILPVRPVNDVNPWIFTPTRWVVEYMGMEDMYIAMAAEPEAMHRLMGIIERDMRAFLRWQESLGLLFLNNGNDYIASGSYNFSDELPRREITDGVRSTDMWGHLNSQESVGISPAMYAEFVLPYYKRIAEQFGLLYYGCCEPVNAYWDSVSQLPNLRKVSISAWCDEAYMGERLAGGKVIYSRKPSPFFIGGQKEFYADEFTEYVKTTARLSRGCKREFIFRDVSTIYGNPGKLRQAVDICRRYGAYE